MDVDRYCSWRQDFGARAGRGREGGRKISTIKLIVAFQEHKVFQIQAGLFYVILYKLTGCMQSLTFLFLQLSYCSPYFKSLLVVEGGFQLQIENNKYW